MQIKIRKAKESDLNGIYSVFLDMADSEDMAMHNSGTSYTRTRIRRKDFEKSAKKELLREIKDSKNLYIVAEIGNKIIGYARATLESKKSPFFKPAKIGHFDAICVLNGHRGKGVSTKLRNEIERWLRQKKCSEIQLDVMESNPAAKIYEKWGYKVFLNKMSKRV